MQGDRRVAQNIYAGDAGHFKICSKCDRPKHLNEYNAKLRNEDGKRSFCRECQSDTQKNYAKNNHQKIRCKNLAWIKNNVEKIRDIHRRHSAERRKSGKTLAYERANREKLSVVKKAWWKNNPNKRKEYNDRQVSTGKGKLEAAIRACVRSEIRFGSKGSRKTFDLLGYSTSELMSHLEAQFQDGMTWENYGRGGWHVDHIRPLSSFRYETPDDPDFKIAWALSNLQPLWQFDNLSKADKFSEVA